MYPHRVTLHLPLFLSGGAFSHKHSDTISHYNNGATSHYNNGATSHENKDSS
jgi:hypothetical protein